VVEAAPASADAASYLMLASKVEATLVGQSLRSVAVVGTEGASGASEVAVNLASALALPGRRVMVVDADPEARGASRALGLEQRPGLTDLLAVLDRSGFADRLDTVLVRQWRHLVALAVGSSPLSSADPERLARLLQHLLEQAEVVVVSTLPVHQGPMGMQWAAATQATIVVAERDGTTRDDYREVVQSLWMADAHVVGAVLHRVSYRGRPRRPEPPVTPPRAGDSVRRDALARGATPEREPTP
jgi:Mrp family chromosome partitioning ATPase